MRMEAVPAEVSACLDRLRGLHHQLCPRQVLGVRMGLEAGRLLGVEVPQTDKRLVAFAETDGCFADGVSVATGAWVGRRTLRLVDYGKVALTVADSLSGRAVRLWPHPLARERAIAYAPTALAPWQAQLAAYQTMPTSELLLAREVDVSVPLREALGRPGVRVTCAACGEEVLNEREVRIAGRTVCRACDGNRYYGGQPTDQGSPAAPHG